MAKSLTLLALVLACSLGVASGQPAPSPWAGTWKLDLAQSKLHSPVPKAITIVVQPSEQPQTTVKWTIHVVPADGAAFDETYDGMYGGKSYPVMVNGKVLAQASYVWQSSHQHSTQWAYTDGRTRAATLVMAANNQSFTAQSHFKTAQGEYDETAVYTRQ